MPDFDVKVICTDDYPLIITVDKDSVADVRGKVPLAQVVQILRHLADHFERQAAQS
ncbi:hypothetical protein ACIQF6_14900 [Kitasatospora sp. NPDC092948]|uniref:hypothetical protein n=1 Tax=Kitasatospora sp. NPDC092948 TaxID=3364088 RepID=UPI003809694A